jgi:hypothetical protein
MFGAIAVGIPAATFENKVAVGDHAVRLFFPALWALANWGLADSLLKLEFFLARVTHVRIRRHRDLLTQHST